MGNVIKGYKGTRVRNHDFNFKIGISHIHYYYESGRKYYQGNLWGIGIFGRIIIKEAKNRDEFIKKVKKDLMKIQSTKKLLK